MDLVKELNLKLTKADLTTELSKKVDTLTLTTELNKKANAADLANKVDTSTLTTKLASKVDTTTLTTELDKKANAADLANKVDISTLTTELDKKADQSALDSKANIKDIIPKNDLQKILDAKINKSELESGGTKEYVDNQLGKKADKSEIEELRRQIENLQKDSKKLSKSIYVEAALTTAIKPWSRVQSSFQFKNLKIEHNTDDLGKSDAKSFTFTAVQEENYLIDASITIKFTKETSGVGLPTFIYKIQIFKGDKWQKTKMMQWQYNGVTQKPNKASKETSSKGDF